VWVPGLARCESATERAPLGDGRAADDIGDRRLRVLAQLGQLWRDVAGRCLPSWILPESRSCRGDTELFQRHLAIPS